MRSNRPSRRQQLLTAVAVAALLGIPMLILQRYVAATRDSAIMLVLAWFAVAGVGVALYVRRRRGLRLAAGGTYLAVLVATVAIGYWTGFRDVVVDEDIVVAAARASAADREQALGSATGPTGGRASTGSGPIELAGGEFAGADGHEGSGTVTVTSSRAGSGFSPSASSTSTRVWTSTSSWSRETGPTSPTGSSWAA